MGLPDYTKLNNKKGGCFRGVLGWVVMGGAAFCALVLVIAVLDRLGIIESDRDGDDTVVVIPSRTPETLETPDVVASVTPIPLPTNTLIPSDSQRIDELFLQVNGVVSVELASERDMGQQIGAVALVTIDAAYSLEGTRDLIWEAWVAHARETYPVDRRLVLDLTINQGGIESIWQNTSNSTDWLRLK